MALNGSDGTPARVVISPVEEAALPDLGEINRLAYQRETISQLAWTNWPDEENTRPYYRERLRGRFGRPGTIIYKASDVSTGEIYGFICMTLEDGLVTEEPKKPTVTTEMLRVQIPPGMNMKFVMNAAPIVESLTELMKGKHYYLSTFAVRPDMQGKGIGSQLMKHCLAIADEAAVVTWLISFPGSHSLYERNGFKDVECRDIDLNKFDENRLRGFGVYRQWAMKREPQQPVTTAS